MMPSKSDARPDKAGLWNELAVQFSTTSAAKIFYLITRVILPPLTLTFVSLEEYGIWAASFVVIGYLGICTFGFANVYIRYVAEFAAARQFDRINRLLSTGVVLATSVSLIALVALWQFLPWLTALLEIPHELQSVGTTLILGAATIFTLEMTVGAFGHMLFALQRIRDHQLVWIASFLLEAILIVALLLTGHGIYSLLWALLARYVGSSGAYYFLIKRALPTFHLSLKKVDRPSVRLLLRTGGIYQFSGALGMFLYSIEKLIAGLFLGVGAVAILDIGQKFPMTGSQVISSTNSVFLPTLSRMKSLAWTSEARELYLRGSRYVNIFAGILMGFLASFSLPLLNAWLGGVDSIGQAATVLVVFTIAFQFHVLTGPTSSMHRAGNKPQRELFYHGIQLFIVGFLVAALQFTVGLTISNIAFAVGGAMAISSLLYSFHGIGLMGVSKSTFLGHVLIPGVTPYLAGFVVRAVTEWGWAWDGLSRWETLARLIPAGAMYLILAATLVFTLHLRPDEKAKVCELLGFVKYQIEGGILRALALALWIVVILLSSTNIAVDYAYSLFDLTVDSLGSLRDTGGYRFYTQKLFHVFLYAVFGFLLWRLRSGNRSWVPLCCALCFLMGGSSEAVQSLFASREAALLDSLLNGSSGCLAVWVAAYTMEARQARPIRRRA